jgi:hydroxyacylglutathione hydrolase
VDFARGAPVAGSFDVRWIHGSASPRALSDPPIQAHAYDPHTVVFRESKDVSFEAPFLYLFFGNDRALLLDTGATADAARFPVRKAVDDAIRSWRRRYGREPYGLVVAHTHSHRDHIAGDLQFAGRPQTTVVGRDRESVRGFLGLGGDPGELATVDLGGRRLEVFEIPGHHPTSIAVYDRWTGWLVTGDTVYPGRLYVRDMPAFVTSLNRLVEFARTRPVTYVVGCHIEMTRTPRLDYPVGTRYQPDEPPLPMSIAQLGAVRDASERFRDVPGAHVFDDFVLFNGPCAGPVLRQWVRAAWLNFRWRIGAPASPGASSAPNGRRS